jgi:hypothetical protein
MARGISSRDFISVLPGIGMGAVLAEKVSMGTESFHQQLVRSTWIENIRPLRRYSTLDNAVNGWHHGSQWKLKRLRLAFLALQFALHLVATLKLYIVVVIPDIPVIRYCPPNNSMNDDPFEATKLCLFISPQIQKWTCRRQVISRRSAVDQSVAFSSADRKA